MKEYVVSREDLRKWCSIPVDELADHPDRKMNLMMGEDKQHAVRKIGNILERMV